MSLVQRRIGLLFAAFLLAFLAIALRAAWIQGVQGGELRASAQNQQTQVVEMPATRGRILDRRGRSLAIAEDAATVYVTPYQLKNPDRTAARLGEALGISPETIIERIGEGSSGFAYVARQISLTAAEEVRNLDIHGVGIVPDSRRSYPQGELASQLIGAVGIDGQGLTGLEAAFDDQLAGADGELQVVRDALGEEISRDVVTEAEPGDDVRLTIDAKIQARAEQALRRIARTHTPAGSVAIVMDPQTSEILALANWPSADLGDIGSATEAELLNRATGFTYEPGSTFKAFTISAALEEKVATPTTQFNLGSTIQVADREIGEAHDFGGGTLTTAQILARSSNVGAVTIGLELGAERFSDWIERFGFGSPTGVDLPGEEQGIVPPYPDGYSGSTIGNLPIGQGLSVTPIQMAAGYAAIANGGILRAPRVIRSVDGETVEPDQERAISRRTSRQVSKMLEGVLAPGGTAAEVSVPGYVLAGKTGTAQKAIEGGYSDTDYVGSFVGYGPAEDPRLLVAVAVDVPQNGYYGGTVAAPAFGEIASFALPYLGIEPS